MHRRDLSAQFRSAVRRKLLAWYDRNKRDLPWRRRAGDPYAQWVAEIMLQQTRVETVIDYYERFLARFPSLKELAAADFDEVLTRWRGLGYYRRILHLHRAARQLADSGQGLPTTVDELRRLPGVGEYTAAAIASIAFQQPAAAVDGNVVRVLSRLTGMKEDVDSPEGKRLIRRSAGELLSRRRPGDFNQAWMDLGSLVCTPRSPRCPVCPLAPLCTAWQRDCVDRFPVSASNRKLKVRDATYLVALFVNGGKMLLRKRPLGGLWSGLWEFPNVLLDGAEDRVRALRTLARQESVRLNGRPKAVGTVEHRLTHRRLSLHVSRCNVEPEKARVNRRQTGWPVAGADGAPRKWVGEKGLAKLSISVAHQKVYALWAGS